MQLIWLGQGGILLKSKGMNIMIDPYFSDSVGKKDPAKHRRIPVSAQYADIKPDVLIFTHNHLDHYDPETVEPILKKHSSITVLCPASVWSSVRQNGGDHNYVIFDRHTQWTENHVRFTAIKAAHSDEFAIGVLIEAEGKTVYVTGDTLYSKEIFKDLPDEIDVVFLPINGVGNNMNHYDAAGFIAESKAKLAVPIHVGMFDTLSGEMLQVDNKVVLNTYETLEV